MSPILTVPDCTQDKTSPEPTITHFGAILEILSFSNRAKLLHMWCEAPESMVKTVWLTLAMFAVAKKALASESVSESCLVLSLSNTRFALASATLAKSLSFLILQSKALAVRVAVQLLERAELGWVTDWLVSSLEGSLVFSLRKEGSRGVLSPSCMFCLDSVLDL